MATKATARNELGSGTGEKFQLRNDWLPADERVKKPFHQVLLPTPAKLLGNCRTPRTERDRSEGNPFGPPGSEPMSRQVYGLIANPCGFVLTEASGKLDDLGATKPVVRSREFPPRQPRCHQALSGDGRPTLPRRSMRRTRTRKAPGRGRRRTRTLRTDRRWSNRS
jgi:hypothetical protein